MSCSEKCEIFGTVRLPCSLDSCGLFYLHYDPRQLDVER